MLPDRDGFAVCREIRRTSDVPVIMVTARADSHDVVAGLEAGADDYVTKPLVAKELSARIRALLRRVAPARARQAGPLGGGGPRLDVAPAGGSRGGGTLAPAPARVQFLARRGRARGQGLGRAEVPCRG